MQFKETNHIKEFEIHFQQIGDNEISEETYYLEDTPKNREFVELILNDFNDIEREKSNELIKYHFMIEGEYTFGFRDIMYFDALGKQWKVEK